MKYDQIVRRLRLLSRDTALPFSLLGEASHPSYFILGSGRSGNTLLRRLLMENYDTFIPPEMPGLGRCLRGLVRNQPLGWKNCSKKFFEEFQKSADVDIPNLKTGSIYNLWRELNLSAEDLISEAQNLDFHSHSCKALVNLLYTNILSASDYSATSHTSIGDKTPWNVMYTHQIDMFFPEAQIIYIVRNPFAVISSYYKAFSDRKGMSLSDAAQRWVISQNNCLDLACRISRDSVLVTQYENLVSCEYERHRVGSFLRIQKLEKERVVHGIMQADSKLSHHKKISRPVDTSSLNSWKTEIKSRDRKNLIRIVDPTIRRLALETGVDYRSVSEF